MRGNKSQRKCINIVRVFSKLQNFQLLLSSLYVYLQSFENKHRFTLIKIKFILKKHHGLLSLKKG